LPPLWIAANRPPELTCTWMRPPASNSHLLTVAAVVASLATLVTAVFALFWVRVLDPDVLLHLRTGRLITESGRIPHRDMFSSNAADRPWVTHEWLWQVGAHGLYLLGTWKALFTLRIILVLGALGCAVALAVRRGAGVTFALAATLLAVGPLASFAEIRPQLASYLLFTATLLVLYAARTRPKWLLALPPIFLLWTNLHGAVLLGFVLLGCAVIDAAWRIFKRKADSPAANLKWLLSMSVACVVATLINPNGYHVFTFPLKVVGQDVFRTQIHEWAPPAFTRPFLPFWVLLGLVVPAALLTRRSLTLADWLLLGIFAAAAMGSRRQGPFFALVAIPILAAAIEKFVAARPARLAAAVTCSALMPAFAVLAYQGAGRTNGTGLMPNRFPEDAAARLAKFDVQAAVLNDYNDGGYLLWKLWPRWRVTMDGRADVYGPDLVQKYQQVWAGAPGWEQLLDQWNVEAILGRYEITAAQPKHNLYHELAKGDEWMPVHWNATGVLYLRAGTALAASELRPYRRLHPGLRWQELAALQTTPAHWDELGADLRRSITEYPENRRAHDLERRWRADEARPPSTRP